MYNDCSIRIERHQNGYTVRITDPAIQKANDKRRGKDNDDAPAREWRDPQVSYAFTTKDEVVEFVKANIDKALPEDEYASTFDKAAEELSK